MPASPAAQTDLWLAGPEPPPTPASPVALAPADTPAGYDALIARARTGAADEVADTLAAPSGFGPLRRIETRQQAAQLLAALAELPPEQREAFLLQAEAEMSVSDIAVATGVGFETAKSRLRYARAALRRALENL